MHNLTHPPSHMSTYFGAKASSLSSEIVGTNGLKQDQGSTDLSICCYTCYVSSGISYILPIPQFFGGVGNYPMNTGLQLFPQEL